VIKSSGFKALAWNLTLSSYDAETFAMRCHICGSGMRPSVTSLPLKLSDTTSVVLKDVPVLQCDNCTQYLLDDPVMERVEGILAKVDTAAELEIIRYAA